ncbi:MAG: PKD domain-containing protein [Solirubrobacteraceae bacterium]
MKRGIALVAAIMAVAFLAPAAWGQKVGNPTNSLSAIVSSGSLTVGSNNYAVTGPVTLFDVATITEDGTITVPADKLSLVIPIPDSSGSTPCGAYTVTNSKITVIPTADALGFLNPFTGAANLDVHFYLQGNYDATACGQSYSPTDCKLGSADQPLEINLITGMTSPPGPNQPISGTPYSDATGKLKLVDNSFALPASQGCDPKFGPFTLPGSFDSQVGLPSPAGNNTLIVSGRLAPIIKRGVRARLTATPRTGLAPLTVAFSAANSFAAAGVKSYTFGFGDGTPAVTRTGNAISHRYSKPGRYTARLKVVDTDGDFDTTTTVITVRRSCIVPNVVGRQLSAARTRLRAAACTVGHVTRRRSTRAAGIVLSQSPAARTKRPAGFAVSLVVSSGH